MKWQFLTIFRAIPEHSKWLKGSIPRTIASMMYVEHLLLVNVDWSTLRMEGFRAIGQRLSAKRPVYIPYVPVLEWFRNNLGLYVDPQAEEGTVQVIGEGQRADEGRE